MNVVASRCRIHNEQSVDVTADCRKVAAFIWVENEIQVGVFSLEAGSVGQLLYRYSGFC